MLLSSISEETEALTLLTQHRSGGCGELLHGCRTRLLGENFQAARCGRATPSGAPPWSTLASLGCLVQWAARTRAPPLGSKGEVKLVQDRCSLYSVPRIPHFRSSKAPVTGTHLASQRTDNTVDEGGD